MTNQPRGPYQTMISELGIHGNYRAIERIMRENHGAPYTGSLDHLSPNEFKQAALEAAKEA